jgi:hypothetical protein
MRVHNAAQNTLELANLVDVEFAAVILTLQKLELCFFLRMRCILLCAQQHVKEKACAGMLTVLLYDTCSE